MNLPFPIIVSFTDLKYFLSNGILYEENYLELACVAEHVAWIRDTTKSNINKMLTYFSMMIFINAFAWWSKEAKSHQGKFLRFFPVSEAFPRLFVAVARCSWLWILHAIAREATLFSENFFFFSNLYRTINLYQVKWDTIPKM